jgi:ubiquinone/menaquinone biosynthesis C-methylase UbiE
MGIVRRLGNQMRKPVGRGGKLMCYFLVLQHAPLTRWAIELMGVGAWDHVLDVGCGNGVALGMIARKAYRGFTAGIDCAEVSVELSRRRNAPAIEEGRAQVSLADVRSLPFADSCFDKVSAIESFYFWGDCVGGLGEIRRVLKPEGRLFIVMELTKDMPHLERNLVLAAKMDCPIFHAAEVEEMMAKAGFRAPLHTTDPKRHWLFVQAQR